MGILQGFRLEFRKFRILVWTITSDSRLNGLHWGQGKSFEHYVFFNSICYILLKICHIEFVYMYVICDLLQDVEVITKINVAFPGKLGLQWLLHILWYASNAFINFLDFSTKAFSWRLWWFQWEPFNDYQKISKRIWIFQSSSLDCKFTSAWYWQATINRCLDWSKSFYLFIAGVSFYVKGYHMYTQV